MAYTSIDQVRELLPDYEILELADDSEARDGGIDDPAVLANVAGAISNADREIDGYVGLVRSVPLSLAPGLIKRMSAQLAVHYLYLRRPRIAEPEQWAKTAERCRRVLEQIANGKVALGASEGQKTAEPDRAGMESERIDKLFGSDVWSRY